MPALPSCRGCCGIFATALPLLLALFLAMVPPPAENPRHSGGSKAKSGGRLAALDLSRNETDGGRLTRAIYLRRLADGFPEESNYGVATFPLPQLKEGEVFVRTRWLSVDPYMRPGMGYRGKKEELPEIELNASSADALEQLRARFVGGLNVGVVVESFGGAGSKLAVGTLVRGFWGWSEGHVAAESALEYHQPPSTALGTIGSTGRTAYYGVFRVLQPKRGEIMFVSGAAGATGAVAGQLGKIAGCRVLGSAGSAEKVQALLDLGFDGAFNYREEDASKALDRLAPEGIDLFFENTGGPVSEAVVSRLRDGARIAVSGLIDWYHDFGDLARMLPKLARAMLPSSLGAALHSLSNPLEVPRAAALKFFTHVSLPLAQMRIGHCDPALVQNQAPRFAGVSFSAENFLVTCFDVDGGRERAEAELGTYVREGRVKHLETLLQGSIEDVPRAFIHMLGGGNKGKQIVELVDQ